MADDEMQHRDALPPSTFQKVKSAAGLAVAAQAIVAAPSVGYFYHEHLHNTNVVARKADVLGALLGVGSGYSEMRQAATNNNTEKGFVKEVLRGLNDAVNPLSSIRPIFDTVREGNFKELPPKVKAVFIAAPLLVAGAGALGWKAASWPDPDKVTTETQHRGTITHQAEAMHAPAAR